jgi:hypothetical protein
MYLFGKRVSRGIVSVTLAVDCRVSTSTNSIHLPVSIVIVHDMEISMSTTAFFMTNIMLLISAKEYTQTYMVPFSEFLHYICTMFVIVLCYRKHKINAPKKVVAGNKLTCLMV